HQMVERLIFQGALAGGAGSGAIVAGSLVGVECATPLRRQLSSQLGTQEIPSECERGRVDGVLTLGKGVLGRQSQRACAVAGIERRVREQGPPCVDKTGVDNQRLTRLVATRQSQNLAGSQFLAGFPAS